MTDLCKRDGGVAVYEIIPLPASEFGRSGFPMERYWLDPKLVETEKRLGPNYRYISRKETIKDGDPERGEGRLVKYIDEIYRVKDGKLLGRSVFYGRAGGDLIVIGHFTTAGCPVPTESLLAGVFSKDEQK